MAAHGETIALETYFEGRDPLARTLFDAVRGAVLSIGPAEIRVTTSQIAFRRQRSFAWTWMPGQYVHGAVAPLVLTVDLGRYDTSPRWKEVVEPTLNHFMHHLELHRTADIDDGVRACLREAWDSAGQPHPGEPRHGLPGPDQPQLGQPRPGQPRPGQPRPGQPRPGQPRPGQPRPGQPL